MTSSGINYSDWKVFLDGIEIPHQGFQVSFIKNRPSDAQIVLEPDTVLKNLRPQSVVSIWFRDRVPDDDITRKIDSEDDLLNSYILYWEGLTQGVVFEKGPESRSMRLQCESMDGIFDRTMAFMLGVGQVSKSVIVSGSVGINPNEVGSSNELLAFATLGEEFTDAPTGTNESFRDNADPSFADRMLRLVTTLSSYNGILRQQVVRYRLLDRLCSVSDNIYSSALVGLGKGLFGPIGQTLEQSHTVTEVLDHVQNYGFYSRYQNPVPHRADAPSATQYFKTYSENSETEKFRIPRSHPRNEFMFLPEMYYFLPPPCNFIFPDNIRSLSVARNYYNEPTRMLVLDPLIAVSGSSFYLSPPNIVRNREFTDVKQDSASLFSIATDAAVSLLDFQTGQSQPSPYTSKTEDINLLNVLSDRELEQGITMKGISQMSFETLVAYARSAETASETDPEVAQVTKIYQRYMSLVTDFMFQMARFNRTIQISLVGHRYLTPGFSAVIFDSDISYLAQVDSVALGVSNLGDETVSASLSRARPLFSIPFDKIDETTKAAIALIEASPEATEFSEEAEVKRDELNKQLSALVGELEQEFDIPIPPPFFNSALSSLAELDGIYKGLLGCRSFYEATSYADLAVPSISSLNSAANATGSLGLFDFTDRGDSDATKRIDHLITYTKGLASLNAVFQIFSPDDSEGSFFAPGTILPDSYQAISESRALNTGTFEWAERNFQKKQGMTLGQYLQDNFLEIEKEESTQPNPTSFWYMRPKQTYKVSGSQLDLDWDDTILSKVVDHSYITSDGSTAFDPAIEKVRREVTTKFLTTAGRQEFLLDYSRRHFGSRAFKGR